MWQGFTLLEPYLPQVPQRKVTGELVDDVAKDFSITFASKVSVKEVRSNDLVVEQLTPRINGPLYSVFIPM